MRGVEGERVYIRCPHTVGRLLTVYCVHPHSVVSTAVALQLVAFVVTGAHLLCRRRRHGPHQDPGNAERNA